jgi:hypothetical protein
MSEGYSKTDRYTECRTKKNLGPSVQLRFSDEVITTPKLVPLYSVKAPLGLGRLRFRFLVTLQRIKLPNIQPSCFVPSLSKYKIHVFPGMLLRYYEISSFRGERL